MTTALTDPTGVNDRPEGWSIRDEFTRAATWQEAGHLADIWDSVMLVNMPEDVYHARPELSSSQMKPLVQGSPKHFQEALSGPRVEKRAWDEGHAIHARVLGIGAPIVEIPDDLLSGEHRSIASAKAKAWVQEARDAGQTPLKSDVYRTIIRAADGVLANPKARRVLLGDGFPEVSMFGADQRTGTRLRGRADYVNVADQPFIVDVKSVDARDGNALSDHRLMRTVDDYNYDLQAELYRYLFEYHTGVVAAPTVLVFCEKKPPYDVRVVTLEGDWSDGGWTKLRRALDVYAQCKESRRWPGVDEDDGPILALPTSSWYRQQIAGDDDLEVNDE
jgi:hypothetical protein